jgi:hypothetical protein
MMNVITMRLFFWMLFLLATDSVLTAQAANNNIESRTELKIDQDWLHSSTANSSVEWSCVNKSLTNKCLVYHNDQWFHFTPETNGKFFLNVSSQQCRDLQGIQVIVIEGNPCEITTYSILQCIPKIHQNDVFIELDSLKAGIQYLVNIDGFLGDFCEFDIQFSTTPAGLPRVMNSLDTIAMEASLKDNQVNLRWTVRESIAKEVKFFRIYRQRESEQRLLIIREVPLRANALGDFDNEYNLQDSLLKHGNYTYRIFGIQKETEYPLLLSERQVFLSGNGDRGKRVNIPLSLKQKEPYLILVFNQADRSLLRKFTGNFDSSDNLIEINLQEFVNRGVKEFIVLASGTISNQPNEFRFRYAGSSMIAVEKK